ncbi:MAG: DUF3052 domain-containing protein [Caulobacteraceae bacterium]|nr:DUF3052 domain-containing protein [Caulobacteraceae bacterium]
MTKLGLKPGQRLLAIDAPQGYADLVGPLPDAASLDLCAWAHACAGAEIVHVFIGQRATLAERAAKLVALPGPGGSVWISWPKKASPLHRDLTDNAVRALILPTGWVDVKVAAVDADWSGLKFVRRRA